MIYFVGETKISDKKANKRTMRKNGTNHVLEYVLIPSVRVLVFHASFIFFGKIILPRDQQVSFVPGQVSTLVGLYYLRSLMEKDDIEIIPHARLLDANCQFNTSGHHGTYLERLPL